MIVAKLVLGSAPEDVPHSEEIRTLIKDIWDMRLAKLRTVMDAYLKGEGTQTKLDNITMLEIHSIRPFFPHMLDLISRLEKSVKISTNQGNTSRNMSSDRR
jgi:GINS complex subunit 2